MFGLAAAADANTAASGVFGGNHVRVAIPNEKCLVRVDTGKSTGGKYHPRGRFTALTSFIRTMRAVEGGCNTAAVLLNPPNDSFMSSPKIAPTDKTAIDSRLVADQNDPDIVSVEVFDRFESIPVKAYFFKALYIIGPVHIQNAVPVQKEEAAVFRLGRTKPHKHFYRSVQSD